MPALVPFDPIAEARRPWSSRSGLLILGALGALLQVRPMSVTGLINHPERLRLVRRTLHEHHGQTTLSSISEDERRLAEDAAQALNDAGIGRIPLRVRELAALFETLRRVRRAEKHIDDGRWRRGAPVRLVGVARRRPRCAEVHQGGV